TSSTSLSLYYHTSPTPSLPPSPSTTLFLPPRWPAMGHRIHHPTDHSLAAVVDPPACLLSDHLDDEVPHTGFNRLTLRRDLKHIVDRKSTRLNSSHQIISYDVFCLKKNKK